jgi:hypothetical protein
MNIKADHRKMQNYPEFPFSTLLTIAPTPNSLSNGKFELGFEPKGLSSAPQRPLLPRVGARCLSRGTAPVLTGV